MRYINKRSLLLIITILLVCTFGVSYAAFRHYETGKQQQLLTGEIYLKFKDNTSSLSLPNMYPETKEEARQRTDNVITFTIDGTSTVTNKDVYYEIYLNEGDEKAGMTRFKPEDIVFDLVEIDENGNRNTILEAVSYSDFNRKRIWVNTVDRNSIINKTYELRMWLSEDVIISDTEENASYTTSQFENSYLSIKVGVYGDFVEKDVSAGYIVYKLGVLDMDDEWISYSSDDTTIKIIDSINNSTNPDFLGWSSVQGGEVEYQPGDSININDLNVDTLKLYPVMRNIVNYIIYDMSILGSENQSTPVYDRTGATISDDITENTLAGFLGWSTTLGGEIVYQPGDKITANDVLNKNLVLSPVIDFSIYNVLSNQVLTMPLTTADSDGTRFVSGQIEDNYVWYSGKLWRIVSIDEDGNIKLVTQGNITTIGWNTEASTDYSTSQVRNWLNNEFLPTLYNAENLLVDHEWDYTTYESFPTQKATENITKLTGENAEKVGLLNIYEYMKTGGTTSSNTSKTFLNISYEWLTMSPSDANNVWLIDSSNYAYRIHGVSSASGVRPSVKLKSGIMILGGTGEKANPYIIEGDKTAGATSELLSNRMSGEYINFNNTKYRIIGFEIINDQKLTKVTMADYKVNRNTLTTSLPFGTTSTCTTTTYNIDEGIGKYLLDWYNATSETDTGGTYSGLYINETYKKMIETDGIKWYKGPDDGTGYDYTLSKSGPPINAPIGLGHYGEMFASQFGDGLNSSIDTWLITIFDQSGIWAVNGTNYGSYGNVCSDWNGVRPSFYLKANVKITGGNGQPGNPYQIAQ